MENIGDTKCDAEEDAQYAQPIMSIMSVQTTVPSFQRRQI